MTSAEFLKSLKEKYIKGEIDEIIFSIGMRMADDMFPNEIEDD